MLLILKYDCFILYFIIVLPNVLCHMVGRDENGRYLIFAFHVFSGEQGSVSCFMPGLLRVPKGEKLRAEAN